jgi:HEAT repeat protein
MDTQRAAKNLLDKYVALRTSDTSGREFNMKELVSLGPQILPVLYEGVNSQDPKYVGACVDAMRMFKDPRSCEILLNVLKTCLLKTEQEIKAGHGSGLWGGIPYDVVMQLGEIGDRRAVEPLLKLLNKKTSRDLLYATCVALGKLGEKRVYESLLAIARWTLKDRGDEASLRYIRGGALQGLGYLGDARAFDVLKGILRDPREWSIQHSACKALVFLKDPRSADLLITVLKEKSASSYTLAAACMGLAELGDARAVEPLIEALKINRPYNYLKDIKDIDVRRTAAECLGVFKDSRAVQPLGALLDDPQQDPQVVKKTVIEALGKIGEPAIDCLLRAYQGQPEPVKGWARMQLLPSPDPRVKEALGGN